MGIGTTDYTSTLNVAGNVNISVGSRYLINGSDLSFNDIQGTLGLDKGGIGTSLASINELKELLGIGISSGYEITDISPAYFNLTTGSGETIGIEKIDNVDYVKPMTFTIYGKNFDRNIKVEFIDIKDNIYSNFVNTIYYDSPVKIRVVTRYIKKDTLLGDILLEESDKFPYKIKIYNKDDSSKYYLSTIKIKRDLYSPEWNINQNFVKILNIGSDIGCDFSLTDSDEPSSNYISYSIEEGITLPADLILDSSTGYIISSNIIVDYTSNLVPSNTILTIKAVSGAVEMERTGNFYILGGPDFITPNEVINEVILSDNIFTLEAVSQADSIINEVTNITYSIETNSDSDADNISLSANKITVTNLDLLGETGRDITVRATDGYGYSSTKTINIKQITGYFMYGTGRNYYGELINNYSSLGNVNNDIRTPELIEWFIDRNITITHFELGKYCSMFVTDEGYVYVCGYNGYGILGLNDQNSRTSPVLVENFINSGTGISNSLINIKKVFTKHNQTYFLTNDGKVYSCGYNNYGQLGLGSDDDRKLMPVLVERYYYNDTQYYNHSEIIITQVESGYEHALFLTNDGKVYSVGRTQHGQLGLGNYSESYNKSFPNLITEFKSYNDGGLTIIETKTHNEIVIKEVSAGYSHSIVLTEDGKVYAFGYNGNGQLGIYNTNSIHTYPRLINKFHDPEVTPDYTSDTITIDHISSLNDFTMFLTNNGEVYSCGRNNYGQLGIINGDTGNQFTPYLIQQYDIRDDGGTLLESIDHTNVKIIKTSCGQNHTIFLADDGKVYSCGATNSSVNYGQLGINTDIYNRWIPTSVSEMDYFSNTEIKDIATGDYHTIFASYKTNLVFAFGYDGYFQLGDDATASNKSSMVLSALIMKPGINVKSISCGDLYNMYLTESGSVYGVGRNSTGQIGINNNDTYIKTPQLVEYFEANGDTSKGGRDAPSEKIIIKQVSCSIYSDSTTIFLTNDGSVYSVGKNNYGQMGIGDYSDYNTPQLIEYFEANGDETKGGRGEGSAKITIDKVIMGAYHVIFISNDGKIYGVGYNENKEYVFGPNSESKYNTPQEIIHFNNSDGINNIKQIACGSFHTIFLTNDGSVYNCGSNSFGELGHGDTLPREEPEIIEYFEAGGRGEGSLKITIEEIFSYNYCTFCRTSDGKFYGFGENNYGQLGLSDITNKDTPQMISYLNNITQIVSSGVHTIFVTNDYRVWGCGKNNNGQLGLGYTSPYVTILEITSEIISLRNLNIIQIELGGEFTTVLTKNKLIKTIPSVSSVYSWGYNNYNRLGYLSSSVPNTYTPNPIQQFSDRSINIIKVTDAEYHSLYLTDDGKVYSIGLNPYGILARGQHTGVYDVPGTYSWICPQGLTSICIVAVGGGGGGGSATNYGGSGGGGGALAWMNNLEVVPGDVYTIIVGAGGSGSSDGGQPGGAGGNTVLRKNGQDIIVAGGGGGGSSKGNLDSTYTAYGASGGLPSFGSSSTFTYGATGGGKGGDTADINYDWCSGGGGAGGYSGDGGKGMGGSAYGSDGGWGTGGSAGGGAAWTASTSSGSAAPGGGVGIFGEGTRGSGGTHWRSDSYTHQEANLQSLLYSSGGSGSGGTPVTVSGNIHTAGGYGGGGGGQSSTYYISNGAGGALRIIPAVTNGITSAFPSTNVGNTINLNNYLEICNKIEDLFIIDIAVSKDASFFVTSEHIVYCCGRNTYGILNASEVDKELYNPVIYNWFTGLDIIKIFCGSHHAMFLSSDNKLYGVGNNIKGQLGLGDNNKTEVVSPPQQVTYFDNIDIKDVSCSWDTHTLVLTANGEVYGFGYDYFGQLGRGNSNSISGSGLPGLATLLSSYNISHFSTSYGSSYFVTTDNKVYSVGYNNYGQLGNSNFTNQPQLQHISYFDTIKITKISGNYYHTIFLAEDGRVFSCGDNSEGQLGIGTENSEEPYGIATIQEVALNGNIINISAGVDISFAW